MPSDILFKKFYKKILQVIQETKKDKESIHELKHILSLHAKNKDFARVLSQLGLHDVKLLIDVLHGTSYEYVGIDCREIFSTYMEQCLPALENYVKTLKSSGNVSQDSLEIIQRQLNTASSLLLGANDNDILSVVYGLVENYEQQPQIFQEITVFLLQKIGYPVVLALIYLLCEQDDNHKLDMLFHMGDLALPALFIALHYPEESVRSAAVDIVKKIRSPKALLALMEVKNDPSLQVRKRLVEALGEIGDHRITPELIEFLQDESAVVRLESVKALGKIRNQEALNALLDVLEDDDWEVRRDAVESMALYGTSASGYLAKALENDNLVVKKIASRILSDLGTQEAVPALMKAIYDNDISVRERAVIALGRIQGENSIVTLMFAFEDKAPLVRFAAIQVLVEVGSRATVHLLNKALKDPEPLIRDRANAAIQEILNREES